MTREFPSRYDQSKERELYRRWEESGAFKPTGKGQPFSIVLPPPNVTGSLHVGHAVVVAIEDLMVRYHRMKGDNTLWIPGVDHAAIATQNVVEKKLRKEQDLTRHQLGREAFLKEVEAFVATTKDRILTQIRSLGASLDWSRLAYTLDDERSLAVRTIFKQMYDAGILYRGNRIVNWCPRCQSTLSDEEVEYREEQTPLYSFKYGPVVISTVRPETKFLDKTIVVHPEDSRYKDLIGTTITVEWIDGPVEARVIADPIVDMEFGTGAMTITPAHSFEDFELAQRHNLPMPLIINEYGKLTEAAGEFAGQKARDARPAIVAKLQAKGLVEKIDEVYIHNLSICYRCGTPIEPLPKLQWFVAVSKPFRDGKSLKDLMLAAVESSDRDSSEVADEGGLLRSGPDTEEQQKIRILPDRYAKVYHHWIHHLRDWCISRQIWFGHRLPVWYCVTRSGDTPGVNAGNHTPGVKEERATTASSTSGESSGHSRGDPGGCPPIVAIETPTECPHCGGSELEQDPDTLDTWFSSGTWTFSTLGWPASAKATAGKPEKTGDLKTFHPTSVLETGYDILFFWLARMILMSQFALGEVPFTTVYLHGLVRDKDRQKMSKSRGNVVDPLGIVEEYGADALRMALLFGTGLGGDTIISEEKVRGMRNFGTKLWNIARFVVTNLENPSEPPFAKGGAPLFVKEGSGEISTITDADRHILAELATTTDIVTRSLEDYRFHLAAEQLYDFIWGTFASTYVEAAKGQLRGGSTSGVRDPETPDVTGPADPELTANTRAILLHILKQSVTLLHPFMPFVTEAIWQQLPKAEGDSALLISQSWPGTTGKGHEA